MFSLIFFVKEDQSIKTHHKTFDKLYCVLERKSQGLFDSCIKKIVLIFVCVCVKVCQRQIKHIFLCLGLKP